MTQPAGASGGSYLVNSSPSDSLVIAFQGTQIAVVYVQGPSFGAFAVELDDTIVQQVNTNAPVYEFNDRFTLSGLTAGAHILRILPAQGVVAIDAFIVQGSLQATPDTGLPTSTATTLTSTETPTNTPAPTTSEAATTVTPSPLVPPVLADMNSGAADWKATAGWSLISENAYGGSGLSWQLTTSTAVENLRWNSTIDLRNLSPTQAIQLSFASRLALISGTARVEVSVDGGNQWLSAGQVTASVDWSSQSVDLSAFTGQIIQIQFVWEPDSAAGDQNAHTQWRLDQISVQLSVPASVTATEAVTTDTGTPTMTLTQTNTPTATETLTPTSTPTFTSIPSDTPTPDAAATDSVLTTDAPPLT